MDQQKRFYVALALFAGLALAAWFALDNSVMMIPVPLWASRSGHPAVSAIHLQLRSATLGILALFALRSWLHLRAEKRQVERESGLEG